MVQFIQGHVAKLVHKQSVSLVSHGVELAAVCRRVLRHVNAIRIRKQGLGLPLMPPEVPGNKFRQKILIEINASGGRLSPREG
jgi:hypothetical protein